MNGLLIRVGIDQAYGKWNAPIDPASGAFAYVPIPDRGQRGGLETSYRDVTDALRAFPGVRLPSELVDQATHLDPDFAHLTYGDTSRRGRGLAQLEHGDVVAFYAGLRPVSAWHDPLVYALIGVYRVAECVRLDSVPKSRWAENAHTRRKEHRADDLILRGIPGQSGRLRRAIPIGEWRSRSYRVRRDLLDAWGALSCKDGFIQRSAVPPRFLDPARFLAWLNRQNVELIAANNP